MFISKSMKFCLAVTIILLSSQYCRILFAQNGSPKLFPKSDDECLIVWQDDSVNEGHSAQLISSEGNLNGANFPIYSNELISFNLLKEYMVSKTYDFISGDIGLSYSTVKAKIYHSINDTTNSFSLTSNFWPECGTGFLGFEELLLSSVNDFIYVYQFDGDLQLLWYTNSGEMISSINFSNEHAYHITADALPDKSALIIWFNYYFAENENTFPYGIYATFIDNNEIVADSILIKSYSYLQEENINLIPTFKIKAMNDSTYQLFIAEPDSSFIYSYLLSSKGEIRNVNRFKLQTGYDFPEENVPAVNTLNISNFSEGGRSLFLATSVYINGLKQVSNCLYYFTEQGSLLQDPIIDTTKVFADDYFQFKTGAETFLNSSMINNEIFIDTYQNFSLIDRKKIGQLSDINKTKNFHPAGFSLNQNYPNPFNSKTIFRFSIPETGQVKLFIYNYRGQIIKTIIDKKMISGRHSIPVDLYDISSGLYFYQLKFQNDIKNRKMLLIK